jgi:hypothetical protein
MITSPARLARGGIAPAAVNESYCAPDQTLTVTDPSKGFQGVA